VAVFQAVQAVLAKSSPADARPEEELGHAVRQMISRAVAPEGVVDIFAAAGLDKPDISILSDEFLAEVRGMPQRNLAVELLQKLLKGELKTRQRKNVVQARSFAEMLERTIRKYQNRAMEAAQVIEELIQLAKEMREANARGEQLGLTEDELAFYDALETNDSAVKMLGDETLRGIARELVETVRNNVTIDWTLFVTNRLTTRFVRTRPSGCLRGCLRGGFWLDRLPARMCPWSTSERLLGGNHQVEGSKRRQSVGSVDAEDRLEERHEDDAKSRSDRGQQTP